MVQRGLSIVVPTYKEADNIPLLVKAIHEAVSGLNRPVEPLLMDDDSNDGTEERVASLKMPWVRLIVRKTNRGLSPAVLEGINNSAYDIVVVMDADLSHPPSSIPNLLAALDAGAEVSVGSRYVAGANTDKNFGLYRRLNSGVSTLLARPLANLRDPMSGFFAFRRNLIERAPYLNPVGYKILLEILVKCSVERIKEVPIHFGDRVHGESKLSLKQQLLYLQHIRRLYIFKYAEKSCLAQFLVVGILGVLVNLTVLTLVDNLGFRRRWAFAAGIGVSMLTNFALNRRLTFSYAREGSLARQFLGFVGACSLGATVNFAVAVLLTNYSAVCHELPQLAALAGIAAGTGLNYVANRLFVFKKATT